MGRDSRMGNDEQWMRLALAVLKQAEADYKISTIRMRQSGIYTADNIDNVHGYLNRVRWKQVKAAKKIIGKSFFRWYEVTDKALPHALQGNKLDCRLFLVAMKARREAQRAYWEEGWKVMKNGGIL